MSPQAAPALSVWNTAPTTAPQGSCSGVELCRADLPTQLVGGARQFRDRARDEDGVRSASKDFCTTAKTLVVVLKSS